MTSGETYTASIARLLRIRRPHLARVHCGVTATTETEQTFFYI